MEQLNCLYFILLNFLIRVGYLHQHYNTSEEGAEGGGNLLLQKIYKKYILSNRSGNEKSCQS